MEVLEFAIKAHKNQYRRDKYKKPYITHPIDVANILKKYNCEDDLVKAGLLHDIIEDTKYTYDDILNLFGKKIADYVNCATEQNKDASWKERKQATIDKIKTLNLNEKLLLCADKVSNLEDMIIMFNNNGYKDFSVFKQGESEQYWYYISMYNNFILDKHPLFDYLKELIDILFVNFKLDDKYLLLECNKLACFFNEQVIVKNNKYYLNNIEYKLDDIKKYYLDKYENL